MPSAFIQMGFNLKMGADSATAEAVEDYVSEFRISRGRNTVTVPATGGKPIEAQRAGSKTHELTLTFIDDRGAASLADILWDLADSDSAEVYFEGTLNEGTVSVTNPKYSGVAVITSTELGGVVGDLRSQSVTFPVTEDGITRTTTGP